MWRVFNSSFATWAVQRIANLVDLEKWSKIQQNEYLVAIVAVHTAENEPRKAWGDLFNDSVVNLHVLHIFLLSPEKPWTKGATHSAIFRRTWRRLGSSEIRIQAMYCV